MMLFFPHFYSRTIKDRYTRKLATGVTIASLECFAITPMQRLKNYEMTRSHAEHFWGGYRRFLFSGGHGGDSLYTELFKGFNAVFCRQVLSWSSFLVLDQYSRDKIKQWLNLGPDELIPSRYLIPAAVVVGVANTTLTIPFDTVQTVMQKSDRSQLSMSGCFSQILREKGVVGLMAGWRPRMIQYTVHAFMTENLIQYLEHLHEARLKRV